MKIVILGWYGTETLGDRAILLGLLKIFQESFGKTNISIGSIYPFFTERSLFEDNDFISLCASESEVSFFNVTDKQTLEVAIINSDLAVMGGGPIMDLHELGILEYAFRIAKNYDTKTALLGCGIGPLFNPKFQVMALNILQMSDLIILRDNVSKKYITDLECSHFKIEKTIHVTFDPAIMPIKVFFDNKKKKDVNSNIVVNFREFPHENFKEGNIQYIDNLFIKLINEISKNYSEVMLFPMHTFSVGGDDRFYLSKLKFISLKDNITVVNKPMSLWELFDLIHSANASIGMRYHSVIFETLLNKNNMIFDYTEPKKGKITGFLEMVQGYNFYSSRYINLQSLTDISVINIKPMIEKKLFSYNETIFNECENTFTYHLKELFKY